MQADIVKAGLFGFGTIGTGVVANLQRNADVIKEKSGVLPVITKIVDIDTERDRGVDLGGATLGKDKKAILDDESIKVVIELIGGVGVARDIVTSALKKGKHVVTANKELIAKHGPELEAVANESGARILFEASVGGGIPIITPLLTCLRANRVKRVLGIVNGTTNFILSEMESSGASFSDILKEAQARGYAEADPTNDVEGFDAGYKATILSSVAFGKHVDPASIFKQGITSISREEMQFASELGYTIKLLAVLEDSGDGIDVRVHPTLLKKDHPLASIHGVLNAIHLEGDPIGPLMFVGEGAGPNATSSAVLGDLIALSCEIAKPGAAPVAAFKPAMLSPIGNVENSFYIRMQVEDRAGVLSDISHCLVDLNVSIASLVQKALKNNKAEIVWLTHKTNEGNMAAALEKIKNLGCVFEITSVLRVLE